MGTSLMDFGFPPPLNSICWSVSNGKSTIVCEFWSSFVVVLVLLMKIAWWTGLTGIAPPPLNLPMFECSARTLWTSDDDGRIGSMFNGRLVPLAFVFFVSGFDLLLCFSVFVMSLCPEVYLFVFFSLVDAIVFWF